MASVMFSTIGQAVGGPLGAAVGASVGASLDGALFASRRGGQDLLVQRSAYGEIVPRLYGRTRVAGQLLWALSPQLGGSKGAGRRAAGTSFAIALSSGPILDVGRIWADGQEIRDSEGRFAESTRMRVHQGGAFQPADPLIAAAEGPEGAPEYRGLAYVVFEDFGLGSFGNRIPNLSFEVIADDLNSEAWLAEMGERAGFSTAESGVGIGAVGYAAASDRLGLDADMVARVAGFVPSLLGGAFGFAGPGRVFDIPVDDLLENERDDPAGVSIGPRPAGLSLGYSDPERDYQAGRQRVARSRAGAELEAGGTVTATAPMARDLALRFLRQAEAGAEVLSIALPWRWMDLGVGDQLRFDGQTRWRVVKREIRGLAIWLEAERVAVLPGLSQPADPGRGLPSAMPAAGPTDLWSFETPVPLRGTGAQLWTAARGGDGWRGAELRLLVGGDELGLGVLGQQGPCGTLLAPLDCGPESIWDEQNTLLLRVADSGPAFESRDLDSVLAGANLLLLGQELLQFRDAVEIGPDEVRLSGLLRGRFGTGYRMARAEIGSPVVQVRPEELVSWPVPLDGIGRSLSLLAYGAGDPPGGTEVTHVIRGDGLGPLAPVHVRAVRSANGALRMSWVPRFRDSWEWGAVDGLEPGYRWHFRGEHGERFERLIGATRLEFSASDQLLLFGAVLPSGECWIEALGDGPEAMRFSLLVRI